MNWDFSLVLFVLVCATGLIWALDRFAWAAARGRAAKAAAQAGGGEDAVRRAAREPLYVEYARAFFPVILIVFVLRSFIVEPFRIPSGSMMPTLVIHDFILVNKFSYGIRLPVINKKIIDLGGPRRGDVVVFRYPRDGVTPYIKRVVGVPGDKIVYEGKKIYVNGQMMPQRPDSTYAVKEDGAVLYETARYKEQLDGVEHDILLSNYPDARSFSEVVPPGHYFVMGDNRDHSSDSRVWGFVPDENLIGKAFLIWFSWDDREQHAWFSPRQIMFDRVGSRVR